jgi:8-oxo-dGTP pyrophosphatase MutT (NUDIX family)
MKKEELIKLLEEYAPSGLEENESKEEILRFVCDNDNFTGRDNKNGHITGAAWIVSKDRKKVLLTHHLKLNMWLQIGGHVEGEEYILETALREASEESGLTTLKCLSNKIYDVDVHLFPKRGEVEAHHHYDIRFLFETDENEELKRQKSESKAMKWIPLDEVPAYAKEDTILRMTNKTR